VAQILPFRAAVPAQPSRTFRFVFRAGDQHILVTLDRWVLGTAPADMLIVEDLDMPDHVMTAALTTLASGRSFRPYAVQEVSLELKGEATAEG
jgi:hypothetical protein